MRAIATCNRDESNGFRTAAKNQGSKTFIAKHFGNFSRFFIGTLKIAQQSAIFNSLAICERMKQAFATDRATTQLTRSLATAGSESKLMRPGKISAIQVLPEKYCTLTVQYKRKATSTNRLCYTRKTLTPTQQRHSKANDWKDCTRKIAHVFLGMDGEQQRHGNNTRLDQTED